MIIVADTSPICYLVLIGCINVIPTLFGRVEIPKAVHDELSAHGAPPVLLEWIVQTPNWLTIHAVTSQADADLVTLHAGEREAILLAEQLRADLIVLDEKAARQIAARRGLNVTGTLGILDAAATRGLVELSSAIEKLKATTFRASPRLLQTLLDKHS